MAQPSAYNRQFNFSNYQASSPTAPVPANYLDAEFNAVKLVLDQIRGRLALLQRDDGALGNQTVGVDQLKSSVNIGFNAPTTWDTGVSFISNDTVFKDSVFYICLVSHISGDFDEDFDAGYWQEIADFVAVASVAQDYADAAEAAQAAAEAAQALAEAARDTTEGYKDEAAASALSAAGYASTATTKASEATTKAAAAATAQAGAETAKSGAEAAQAAAEAAASNAATYADRYKGTSTSSVAIGTGSKSFTTQASKFFDVGVWVQIASDANSANYMFGQVTAYSGTSLTVNVVAVGGSGTKSDWTITVSGHQGVKGDPGVGTGDMLSTENLADLDDVSAALSNLGFSANAKSLIAQSYAGMRALLDLEAGTDFLSPSAITALLAGYQPLDSDLTAIAELATTSYGRSLLTQANAAAAATTLGLGASSSPQFAGVNVGHASDTTITRAAAGRIAVEGVNVPLAPSSATFPVGAVAFVRIISGSVANGDTISGANLRLVTFNNRIGSIGFDVGTGQAQTGTWRNVSGDTLDASGMPGSIIMGQCVRES